MTTQDKPAVGPLSAGDLNRAHAAWVMALAKLPDDVEVNMTTEEAQTALRAALEAVIRAPTAPVEAGGSERDISGETFLGFRVAAWRYRQGDETEKLPHHYAEHWSTPGASAWGVQRLFTEEQLQRALNLRPQPSGETREAVARVEAFLDSVRGLIRQEGRTLDPADLRTILALLRPAAPDGGVDAEFEVRQGGELVASTYGPRDRAHAEAQHYAAVYGQNGPVQVFEIIRRPVPELTTAIPSSEGGRG